MEYKVKGTIDKVLDVQTGITKAGKEWKKLTFTITNNEGYEGCEMLYSFEVFGAEKVENFEKYNKVGQNVEVNFNVQTNEWNDKFYTSLQAWKVMAGERVEQSAETPQLVEEEGSDSLPF